MLPKCRTPVLLPLFWPTSPSPLFLLRQPHRLPCFSCVNPTVPPMSPPAPQANPTMPPFLLLPLTCTEPCTAVTPILLLNTDLHRALHRRTPYSLAEH